MVYGGLRQRLAALFFPNCRQRIAASIAAFVLCWMTVSERIGCVWSNVSDSLCQASPKDYGLTEEEALEPRRRSRSPRRRLGYELANKGDKGKSKGCGKGKDGGKGTGGGKCKDADKVKLKPAPPKSRPPLATMASHALASQQEEAKVEWV